MALQGQPAEEPAEDQVEEAERHVCDHAAAGQDRSLQITGPGRLLEPHTLEQAIEVARRKAFVIRHRVRNFYSVSISRGYHIAEAGVNPISQLAFTPHAHLLMNSGISRAALHPEAHGPDAYYGNPTSASDPRYEVSAVIGRGGRPLGRRRAG